MLAITYDVQPWRWLACKAIGALRPAVYHSRLSGLRLREVPDPALPGPDWVRLRTILGGICGTDLGLIFQRSHPASVMRSFTSFPIQLGHENVSVIDQVGDDVAGWNVSQRVCVEPALSCTARGETEPCQPCADGLFSLCERTTGSALPAGAMIGLNSFTGGTWSPYFVAHQSQLHAVPDELPDEAAVLVDPLACSLHGVLRHRPADSDRVLILGGGIIALGVAGCLRALGHKPSVTAVVRHAYQAECMQRYGVDTVLRFGRKSTQQERFDRIAELVGGKRVPGRYGNQMLLGGFDVVYECTGSGAGLAEAMKFTRPRGTVVALGTSQICLVDTTALWFKEIQVIGAFGRQWESSDSPGNANTADNTGDRVHTYAWTMDLLRSGALNADGLLTHTYPQREYRKALRDSTSRGTSGVIKAAFQHDGKPD